ncbi:hypothetical protein [Aquimarina mytili]|uniref:Uncharacterized protein n=1 Tax=Aquimarina mytili TaxID=874423 RepID=A0A937D8V4_9FLAO|nr:hypothetical protein [Aquimarina mytili]MBL0684445.1 hypothetical protein [Aquimarina mytili]
MHRIIKVKKSLILLILPFVFFGQDNDKQNSYYDWFDKVLGKEHTGLYNGKQYVDLDVNRIYENKNAFFLSDKVMLGSVTYDGQTYYNIGMKYNLEKDMLLVALKSATTASTIQLISDKIEEFVIEDFRFKRVVGSFEEGDLINGFYQVLVENSSYSLLKKHKKNRRKIIQAGKLVSYKFVSDNSYILFVNQGFKKITTKADIINIYPIHKKEIKEFYEAYKRLRKSDPDQFMQRLFRRVINSSSL